MRLQAKMNFPSSRCRETRLTRTAITLRVVAQSRQAEEAAEHAV